MVSKTLAISFLLALTSAQIADMERNFKVVKTLTGVDGGENTEVTGWANLKYAAGVITGRVCYQSNAACSPEDGWALDSCLDVTQGTYNVDGSRTSHVIEGYTLEETVEQSFIVGDELYTSRYYDSRGAPYLTFNQNKVQSKSSELGSMTMNTVYTTDETAESYCAAVPFGNTLIQVVEGNNGGACKSDRSCTDIAGEGEAAATPQCCGTGAPADGDAITDVCGDGLATEETFTPGFKRAGVDYAHACSAFKLVSSAASAIATAYLM